MKRIFFALVLCGATFGVASAHAYLETSNPATGATLQTAPEQITLNFSEPLELRFSTFKVAPLETDATDPREIKLAAMDLVEEVVERESEVQLEVEVLTAERTAKEVVLGLSDLSPGTYVVMWRLLSTDTHTSDDFVTFTVSPDANTSSTDTSAGD